MRNGISIHIVGMPFLNLLNSRNVLNDFEKIDAFSHVL